MKPKLEYLDHIYRDMQLERLEWEPIIVETVQTDAGNPVSGIVNSRMSEKVAGGN